MSNVNSIGIKVDTDKYSGIKPATLIATSGSPFTVLLNASRSYTLNHDGENDYGQTDTNTIYLSVSGNVVTDFAPDDAKLKLKDGKPLTIGPGVDRITFRTSAGSPTFSVIPNIINYGDY